MPEAAVSRQVDHEVDVGAGLGLGLIRLSDCLGTPRRADDLLAQCAAAPPTGSVVFDAAAVSFVCPYGAIVLLSACRHLARERGRPVVLVGLQEHVHAYLHRLDFFRAGEGSVVTNRRLHGSAALLRSSASLNVLEMTVVRSLREVYDATAHALLIFKAWLGMDVSAAHRVACCIAEACENVIEHSQDTGVLVAQKYVYADWTEVQLAIADVGIGIRQSLQSAHAEMRDTPAGWIKRAVAGLSRRAGGGGVGLGEIRRIATRTGGSLQIRSGAGRAVYGSNYARYTDLSAELGGLPGTQLSVTLRNIR